MRWITIIRAKFSGVEGAIPPDLIDNSVVRVHFDHDKGRIGSLTYNLGSGQELLDQYWNDQNGHGLGRVGDEVGTTVSSWYVGSDSAVFEYENPVYGTKRFDMRWSPAIGVEMKFTFDITQADTFIEGAYWELGGDERESNDSLRVRQLDGGMLGDW